MQLQCVLFIISNPVRGQDTGKLKLLYLFYKHHSNSCYFPSFARSPAIIPAWKYTKRIKIWVYAQEELIPRIPPCTQTKTKKHTPNAPTHTTRISKIFVQKTQNQTEETNPRFMPAHPRYANESLSLPSQTPTEMKLPQKRRPCVSQCQRRKRKEEKR